MGLASLAVRVFITAGEPLEVRREKGEGVETLEESRRAERTDESVEVHDGILSIRWHSSIFFKWW